MSTSLAQRLQLGITHHEADRLRDAQVIYRSILEEQPQHPDANHLLGVIAHQQGKNDMALELIEAAIEINPDVAGFHNNLGNVLKALGRQEEAIPRYQQALAIEPDYADAFNNCGIALKELGRYEEAIASYERALVIKPDHVAVHNNLGNVLKELGRQEEAITRYEAALVLKHDYADAHNNLGNALMNVGRLEDAISSYKTGLNINPKDSACHSNLITCMAYVEGIDQQVLFQQHLDWAKRHAAPLSHLIKAHDNKVDPERCLRIGFVSADLWRHPVAYFIAPLLENIDRRVFDVHIFSDTLNKDSMTGQLKKRVFAWHDIIGRTDEQVASLIHGLQIDILVDLAGHTAGNRLLVFARKPAPLQISYLGDAATTGLSTMDYRLCDAWTDPPGQSEKYYTEQLLRLPSGFSCYRPLDISPELSESPFYSNGFITFTSVNTAAKITPVMIRIWAEILEAVPDSRLVFKSWLSATEDNWRFIKEKFRDRGIGSERLVFRDRTSLADHLGFYNQVDIALDSFPFTAHTNTCEALWMGVPVVSLVGNSYVSRKGLSLLSSIGLHECIARTTSAYVQSAIKLATDPARLNTLRGELRPRMRASPLTDAAEFTASFESTLRQIWIDWCSGKSHRSSTLGSSEED